jgi:two-component system, NtrC family, response regulator HydG
MSYKILVVDDDPYFNKMLSAFLERNNFDVTSVLTADSAAEYLKSETTDLILTDYILPDMDGLDLIKKIKENHQDQTFILMTNYSDIRTAVKSIKLGAFEFVTKPINPDELLITINAAIAQKQNKNHNGTSKGPIASKHYSIGKYLIGKSPASRQLYEHVLLVAPTKLSVLIMGESGTGKEYVARMVHESSSRKQNKFVSVDCGVLSRELAASELFGHVKGAFTGALQDKIGQFEVANGGTLFLDEIGNLSYEIQMQLLRVLQEQKVRKIGSEKHVSIDVRLIAATNDPIASMVDKKMFRLDLYHRLNEFELTLKPLRERIEDLPDFLEQFLKQSNQELGKEVEKFDDEVMEIFMNYTWPGNLRELKNVVRRAVLMAHSNVVQLSQLPETIKEDVKSLRTGLDSDQRSIIDVPTNNLKLLQEQQEKVMIEQILFKTKYNKSKAAAILNIDRTTLYNKIAKYKIEI